MKRCVECGTKFSEDKTQCPYCGSKNISWWQEPSKNEDKKDFGLCVLSFFFPIIGIVLYFVWNKDYPKKANGCAVGSILGIVSSLVITFMTNCQIYLYFMNLFNSLM